MAQQSHILRCARHGQQLDSEARRRQSTVEEDVAHQFKESVCRRLCVVALYDTLLQDVENGRQQIFER